MYFFIYIKVFLYFELCLDTEINNFMWLRTCSKRNEDNTVFSIKEKGKLPVKIKADFSHPQELSCRFRINMSGKCSLL